MIKINKGAAPPALVKANTRHNASNAIKYLANKANYDNGNEAFTFTAAYHSNAVKLALNAAQFGKCAFCEAKFVNDDAHVEHFRPKGKVDQYPSGPSSYPGYYWLAYEWSNLLLCKSTTNSSIKRNFFPLRGRVTRNLNHLGTNIESSLLIDPAAEDPRDHIRFYGEEIKGITARGRRNISFFDLRNAQIDESRRKHYRALKAIKVGVDALLATGSTVNDPDVAEMIAILKESVLPSAQFSSMAIDLLQGWPHMV